jgi:hypothetical protein
MKSNCKPDDCSVGETEQDREKSISRNYHWLQKILCRKILCTLKMMSAGGNQNSKQKLFTSSKAQGAEQKQKTKKEPQNRNWQPELEKRNLSRNPRRWTRRGKLLQAGNNKPEQK